MKKTISVLKHAVAGALLFSPLAVLAQATPTPTATLPRPVSDISGFLGYICTGANLLFTVIMVLSVLILLFAAFLFLTSGGDEEKTGSARANTLPTRSWVWSLRSLHEASS